MDLSPFVITLLAVCLPLIALFAVAAWLAARRVERVRVVDRQGRTLAEVVIGNRPGGD
jgi:hypothetical protein